MRPLSSSLPFIDNPASDPGTWVAAMPVSFNRASVEVPGPANTCPPQLSQYRPRRSERIRPPTRSPDSSTAMSQCRSFQAADRPARPPPTITTSFTGLLPLDPLLGSVVVSASVVYASE